MKCNRMVLFATLLAAVLTLPASLAAPVPAGLKAADWSSIVLQMNPISQQAYLKASNTETYDGFGNGVAVSGDAVVIGAPYESRNATGINGNQTNNGALQRRTAPFWTAPAERSDDGAFARR